MKTLIVTIGALLVGLPYYAQVIEEEGDTTKFKLGKTTIIIIEEEKEGEDENEWNEESDSWDVFEEGGEQEDRKPRKSEAHWSGINVGISMLMDEKFDNSFPDHPYWRNDPARSWVWDLNLFEHKFNFGTPYVGLTTGLGASFTSVSFKDNYVIQSNVDTVYAMIDTSVVYSKNKLKASYLTIPLLLEFNTSAYSHKSFYLAAGVIGGVRMTSKIKQTGEKEGKEFKDKTKGRFGLNPFKLDAAVRMGYSDWGVFANYNLLSMFEEEKTVGVHPLTFGLSFNF